MNLRGCAVVLVVVALALVAATPLVSAQPAPRAHQRGVHALDTSGDHPLTTVASYTGQMDVAVVGVPVDGSASPAGTFNLSGMPTGAAIQAAWVVIIDYSGATDASLTFGGTSVGDVPPTYVDPGYPLEVWRFDVTSLVTGNGAYSFATVGPLQCYGVALVVVFSHTSLPIQQIVINMGAEDLENASSTTSFAGFTLPGAGRLIVFTGADDTSTDVGESLAFNGVTIPGVTFHENLGPVTSLITSSVTVQAGTNTATATTGDDQFGWALAIVAASAEPPIPAASHLGLALLAVAIAAFAVLLLVRRSSAA